jgi:hypothetical protein
MNTIILTETNIEKNTNNSNLLYSFQGSTTFKNSTIALASVNLFFGSFNITKKYNNNTLSYKWFDINGILNQIIEITISDGYYSVNTLNEFLQSEFVKKGHYLIDSNNKYVYFFEMQSNCTYYSIQINVYPMITNDNSINFNF